MSANEHIDELLSGFLDGELSAEELRELEAAMSADTSLGLKLEQLRQLGNDLRSMPKRMLAPDFANRVLAAAQQAALVSDTSAAEDVRNPPTVQIGERNSYGWRTVGAVAALAASLLFAVYVSNWISAPGEGIAIVPSTNVAPADSNPAEFNPGRGDSSLAGAEKQDDTFVGNDPNMRQRIQGQLGFAVLPIIELEPSLKAWNTNEVAAVLQKEGIVWSKPVNASDKVITVLNETRSINQGLPKSNDDEQVALVMVKASGRAIDKATLRIYERKNDFPHVFMDMAFDVPGKELCKELFENLVGQQPPSAVPMVIGAVANGGLESVSQFSGTRPTKFNKPSAEPFASAAMTDAEDEICYLLLVIRKPAK